MTNTPSDNPTGPSDTQVEQSMGLLLRWGVIIAAVVVLIGAGLYLAQNGNAEPDYSKFHGTPSQVHTLRGTWQAALAGNGTAVIQIGVLLLVATPIARVALSVYVFLRQRDMRYVAVTLFVLAILLYSIVHGYLMDAPSQS